VIVVVLLVVVAVLVAVLVVAVLCRRRYTTAVVRGTSMAPTFGDGTRLLVVRGGFRTGDVVVFRVAPAFRGDPAYRVKRVAATAGEPTPDWLDVPEPTVPPGTLVVSGDNPHSQDSRHLGFVPAASVVGRARLK
jgi:signal peptidase I